MPPFEYSAGKSSKGLRNWNKRYYTKINVNQWKIKTRDRVKWRSITGAVLAW
jgi:hypothetical protein